MEINIIKTTPHEEYAKTDVLIIKDGLYGFTTVYLDPSIDVTTHITENITDIWTEILKNTSGQGKASYLIGWSEARALSYPTWQDQFDDIYNDKKNGTTNWDDKIEAVKIKYPKA